MNAFLRQPGPPWWPLRLRLLAAIVLGTLCGVGSCNPTATRTQNPSTLWVSYGQTELDLVLADTEPPYY